MRSSTPLSHNDPATSEDSSTTGPTLATSDSSSKTSIALDKQAPNVTSDTSPESKCQALYREPKVCFRTAVVIPAAATRYLQSHPFWIKRSIQLHCSLSTDVFSIEGKLHPIMRVCARPKDCQRALCFAEALTKQSRFRTVVVLNEEAEAGHRGKSKNRGKTRGRDVAGQNEVKGSPYDVVETDEGIVHFEFQERDYSRETSDKGVSDGAGNERAGGGSCNSSGGRQGQDGDGDRDKGSGGGGGGGRNNGGRDPNYANILSISNWHSGNPLITPFGVLTTIKFPHEDRHKGVLNLSLHCRPDWRTSEAHVLISAGDSSYAQSSTPYPPNGSIIGGIEIKIEVNPKAWDDVETDPPNVPPPFGLRFETFYRGVPSQKNKRLISQHVLFAQQVSIPNIYSFQSTYKALDAVIEDIWSPKDDVVPQVVTSSSTSPPVGHRLPFSILSQKLRKSTFGRDSEKIPVADLMAGSSALAQDSPQASTPTTSDGWSLFPEVNTSRIGRVRAELLMARGHILTTVKNVFRRAHSADSDMMVEYSEGKAKRSEFRPSSSDIFKGVFGT